MHHTHTNWLLRATSPGPSHHAISPWAHCQSSASTISCRYKTLWNSLPHQGTDTLGRCVVRAAKGLVLFLLRHLWRLTTSAALPKRNANTFVAKIDGLKEVRSKTSFLTPEPVAGTCYLGDVASIIRSKNAGPYELTFDGMFDDDGNLRKGQELRHSDPSHCGPAVPYRRRRRFCVHVPGLRTCFQGHH